MQQNQITAEQAEQQADQLYNQKDYGKALDIYFQLYKLNNQNPAIYLKMGRCLQYLQNYEKAIEVLTPLQNMNPALLEANIRYAMCLNKLGKVSEAEELLNKVDAENLVKQDRILYLQTSVSINSVLGNKELVTKSARELLKLQEDNFNALVIYFTFKNTDDEDADLINKYADKADAVEQNPTKYKEPENLFFALGKAFENRKDYEKAANYYKKGNDIFGHSNKFDPSNTDYVVSANQEVFTKEFFEERKDFGSSSNAPIFVLGLPRSSTSLTEQILASHSKVYGAGELDDIIGLGNISKEFLKSEKDYPYCLQDASKEQISLLAKAYLDKISNISGNSKYVVDKMPFNTLHIGFIKLMFPNAKIINCVRDARDIATSIFSTKFQNSIEWNQNFDCIYHMMKAYLDMMRYWQEVLQIEIYNCNYENLLNNQEEETRKLLDYCGLDWEDECLEFYKTKRAVQTASKAQVKQPIFKSSLGKWKNYEPFFGEELKKIGELNDSQIF